MDKFYMADSFDRGTNLAYCTKNDVSDSIAYAVNSCSVDSINTMGELTKSIAKCSVSTESVTEELRRLQKEFEEFKKSVDKVEVKKGLRGELKTLRVRVRESEL